MVSRAAVRHLVSFLHDTAQMIIPCTIKTSVQNRQNHHLEGAPPCNFEINERFRAHFFQKTGNKPSLQQPLMRVFEWVLEFQRCLLVHTPACSRALTHTRTLTHTHAYSQPTPACSPILTHTRTLTHTPAYSCILAAYSCLLLPTLAYSCILTHTQAHSGALFEIVKNFKEPFVFAWLQQYSIIPTIAIYGSSYD